MGNGPDINGKQIFDANQQELSTEEQKLISENLKEFQNQFGTFKSDILHNLDTANKNILMNLYDTDKESKEWIDGITNTITGDGTYAGQYATIANRDKPRKLMATMQM